MASSHVISGSISWTKRCCCCRMLSIFCRIIFVVLSSMQLSNAEDSWTTRAPVNNLQFWAEQFGSSVYEKCAQATAISDIQTDYLSMDARIRRVDGHQLISDAKHNIELLFSQKEQAVKRLVQDAELAQAEYEYDPELQELHYLRSKKLKLSLLTLKRSRNFNDVEVNTSTSTVHVPTNVYYQSTEVLNSVAWSDQLDETFRFNYNNDSRMNWQHFCSSTGFLRHFPGAVWRTPLMINSKIDMFDCRMEPWYIQASTFSKDVVILMDRSGSLKGLRLEIAKATVEKILNTLTEDDYFNVITYEEIAEYADQCFNGTLVQATSTNKRRIIDALAKVRAHHMTFLDTALIEAFELLAMLNSTGVRTRCNKAVMIITDGSFETYEEIFLKYSEIAQQIRVFTFMVGREVGEVSQIRWMACNHKGRFSHLSSIADVHEHVQEAVLTISRPMVQHRHRRASWSKLHQTAISDRNGKGLEFVTSVSQPVYDVKNTSMNAGKLLGVVGTDVPIKEIIDTIPRFKLGTHGYAFMVTNNGLVMFHPGLRRMLPGNKKLAPDYSSIDLAEIELTDLNGKLRQRMIDRITGNLNFKSLYHFDNNGRISLTYNYYFFTPIDNTPFSIGIALSSNGLYLVDGCKEVSADGLSALSTGNVIVAPWPYCKFYDERYGTRENLIKFLGFHLRGLNIDDIKCNMELMESLLFDAEASRGAESSWRKMHFGDLQNDSIKLVFIGTKAGLTRYLTFDKDSKDSSTQPPEFITEHVSTVEEVYYRRAASFGQGNFVFSIQTNPVGGTNIKLETSSLMVTASSPILMSDEHREAVAAVVGLQFTYSSFYEHFVNSTQMCPGLSQCNFTCQSPDIECFLVDDNGYVILSENTDEVGQVFGHFEGTGMIMRKLSNADDDDDEDLEDGSQRNNQFSKKSSGRVFKRILVEDHQSVCDVIARPSHTMQSTAQSLQQNLLSMLSSVITCTIHYLAFVIANVWTNSEASSSTTTTTTTSNTNTTPVGSLADKLNVTMSTVSRPQYDPFSDETYMPDFSALSGYGSADQVREWINEFYEIRREGPGWAKRIHYRISELHRHYGPRVVGIRRCMKQYVRYLADFSRLPYTDKLDSNVCDNDCSKWFSVHHVRRTNLLLVVIDAHHSCLNDKPIDSEVPDDSMWKHDEMAICSRLQMESYRKPPEDCHGFHEHEDSSDCGQDVNSARQPAVDHQLFIVYIFCLMCISRKIV